jgi:hypothetical protein
MIPELEPESIPEPVDPNVPHPESYDRVRQFLDENPDLVSYAMDLLMDLSGATCPASTKQAVIDHLTEPRPETFVEGAILKLSLVDLRSLISEALRS